MGLFISGDGRSQQELNDDYFAQKAQSQQEAYIKALEEDVETSKAYIAGLEEEIVTLRSKLEYLQSKGGMIGAMIRRMT